MALYNTYLIPDLQLTKLLICPVAYVGVQVRQDVTRNVLVADDKPLRVRPLCMAWLFGIAGVPPDPNCQL